MAEPTQSPALPSTADAAPYVSVSWTAVAAVLVAGLFALLLLILGGIAFIYRKPLLMEELLVLPVITVVLSFAARRVVRNSEGTRTGERLAAGAWWTALVLGLGFAAYLGAISYSVRREAASEVEQWFGLVRNGDVEGAFYQTLDPRARQGIGRTDTYKLQMLHGTDKLLVFRNSDLVKLAQRNKDDDGRFTYTPTGVSDWSYKPGTIDCAFAGTVTCREGKFPVVVQLKGIEATTGAGAGGRQWMIVPPQSGAGFIQQDKAERTSYGWFVVLLEMNGGVVGKAFVHHAGFGPSGHAYLYRAFIAQNTPPSEIFSWVEVTRDPRTHIPVAISQGVADFAAGPQSRPSYAEYLASNLFKLPGGAEPTPAQRDKFLASWNVLSLTEAGRRLKDPGGGVPDKENVLKITDTAVEVHVPVELPIHNTVGKPETARGRVVVECKDPELLADLKERRANWKNETPTSAPAAELVRWTTARWRVVRIESDLVPVALQAPGGGPGGAPGGLAAPPPAPIGG